MKMGSIRYLVTTGFKNVWNNIMMSLASMGVLMLCLLLTGIAVLFSINVNTILSSIESHNNIQIFLKSDISALDAVQIGQKIKKVPNVDKCTFVSKEETAEKVSKSLKGGPLADGLSGPDNPFPHSFDIVLEDLSQYNQTIEEIRKIDGVDVISDISEVASKLTKFDRFVSTAGIWIILVFSAVSLFIMVNTIRITMYSRRLEISIMKSVGATDWFVRVPFIVEGMLIGIISAILASIVLFFAWGGALSYVKNHMMPFSNIEFTNLNLPMVLIFIAIGIIFGLIGGMISIQRYLKKEGGDIIGI